MSTVKAGDVMSNPSIVCLPTETAWEIGLYLAACHCHGIPVVNAEKEIIGMVTENDLLRAIEEGHDLARVSVKTLMTETVMTTDWSDDLDSVLALMNAAHVSQIPVVRGNKLVGVITTKDILRHHLKPGFIPFGKLTCH